MTKGAEKYQPNPEAEGPIEPVVLSSREEQSAAFWAIYSYLNIHTEHEVNGLLKDEMVKGNNALRSVLTQLATSLGKDREYRPEDWLFVGLTDFIPEDRLHEWAHPKELPHWTEEKFHRIARYFERKLRNRRKTES